MTAPWARRSLIPTQDASDDNQQWRSVGSVLPNDIKYLVNDAKASQG